MKKIILILILLVSTFIYLSEQVSASSCIKFPGWTNNITECCTKTAYMKVPFTDTVICAPSTLLTKVLPAISIFKKIYYNDTGMSDINEMLSEKNLTYEKLTALTDKVIEDKNREETLREQYIWQEQMLHEEKKNRIQDATIDAWSYNLGIIYIVVELLKIIFYVVSINLIIYFLLVLIPGLFIRFRDAIVDAYLRRNAP